MFLGNLPSWDWSRKIRNCWMVLFFDRSPSFIKHPAYLTLLMKHVVGQTGYHCYMYIPENPVGKRVLVECGDELTSSHCPTRIADGGPPATPQPTRMADGGPPATLSPHVWLMVVPQPTRMADGGPPATLSPHVWLMVVPQPTLSPHVWLVVVPQPPSAHPLFYRISISQKLHINYGCKV